MEFPAESEPLTVVGVIGAIALLKESMEWADRHAIIDPLKRKLEPMIIRRFNRQLSHLLKVGVPKLDSYFVEAATLTKPPKTAVEAVVDSLDSFKFPLFDRTFESAVATAVIDGAGLSNAGGLQVSFNLKSDPVAHYVRTRSAERMGADVDETTKARLRTTITKGYEESWSRRQLVKEIKALYKGFTTRVPQKNIGSRAELIALTELGNAMSYGTLEGAKSLQAQGVLMEKSWGLASGACALCQTNAGQEWIGLGKAFASGHQMPLAHPACKCTLLTRAKTV